MIWCYNIYCVKLPPSGAPAMHVFFTSSAVEVIEPVLYGFMGPKYTLCITSMVQGYVVHHWPALITTGLRCALWRTRETYVCTDIHFGVHNVAENSQILDMYGLGGAHDDLSCSLWTVISYHLDGAQCKVVSLDGQTDEGHYQRYYFSVSQWIMKTETKSNICIKLTILTESSSITILAFTIPVDTVRFSERSFTVIFTCSTTTYIVRDHRHVVVH